MCKFRIQTGVAIGGELSSLGTSWLAILGANILRIGVQQGAQQHTNKGAQQNMRRGKMTNNARMHSGRRCRGYLRKPDIFH